MPIPVLTQDEITQMQKESASAASSAATFSASVPAQIVRAAELAKVDSGFKKFFDYYDSQIISQYDLERQAINGQYVDTPIVEADIVATASLLGNRIQPSLPSTDIIRIPQFDGSPLLTNPSNELQAILDQAGVEATLVSGYGGSTPASSIVTNSVITPSSTTLQLEDSSATYSIAPNSVYVIQNGGDLAVIKILTFVMQSSPVPPPYVANCTIQMIVPPSGTISTGQILTSFNGFTNSERTSKTASNPGFQPLMNYLVSELQSKITTRISSLTSMLIPISANQDPDGVTELTQASLDVNTSKTFLTNYLVSTIISDSGLGTLSVERSLRTTQANTRVSQINVAYTGRTKNYYNERYSFANNRANTSRGSLRLQKNAEQAAAASAGFATTLANQASAINSILP